MTNPKLGTSQKFSIMYMPTSISMKTFRKEISNGILFWEHGACERTSCAGCFV